MSGSLALFLATVVVLALVSIDRRYRAMPSKGSWIVLLWVVWISSRPLAQWLVALGIDVSLSETGNSVDAIAYSLLFASSVAVLLKRRVRWVGLVWGNKLLFALYAFLALTSLWSFGGSWETFEGVMKNFLCVLVSLVLLTESDPREAMMTVFSRAAYVLFPLSLVLIKYFPEIGRVASRSGEHMFTGVAMHKNALGLTVLVCGLVVLWNIVLVLRDDQRSTKGLQLKALYATIGFGAWLLYLSNSVTAQVCAVLGGVMLVGVPLLRSIAKTRRAILTAAALLGICIVGLNATFDLWGAFTVAVGRDPTLTGRTEIWEAVKSTRRNEMLGYGFASYWDSPEGQAISAEFQGTLGTVHNGFREMSLDAGLVGFMLLILLVAASGWRAMASGIGAAVDARFTVTIWLVALAYNLAETSYFRSDPMWLALLMVTMFVVTRDSSRVGIAGVARAQAGGPSSPQVRRWQGADAWVGRGRWAERGSGHVGAKWSALESRRKAIRQ